MERPWSAASSSNNTAPTTTTSTGLAHRRNASSSAKNGIKLSGSNVISLFVTNLRLLNLDLLADWPNITTTSFGNQDARTRTKCTEYALYQLFRVYDAATTADKLQPFFPPLEPLQSVNLRAALFRCLNELKKSGALSKETVLRKSMLDDCQGERFWEVCLSFSAVVLRRQIHKKEKRSSRYGSKPIAERLGNAQGLSRGQRESMLPLAIAHRAALGKVLDEKQRKRDTYARLHDVLAQKEEELRQRKAKSQEVAQKMKTVKPQQLKAIEQAVEMNWIGGTDLKDALVDGDTCPQGDGMLLQPFDKLWNADLKDSRLGSDGVEVGLLQSLNDRASEQTARLRRWQTFHDRLVASKPPSARSSRPTSVTQKGPVVFNRHRDINLLEARQQHNTHAQQRQATHHTRATSYDEILTAMREDLRKNSAHRNQPDTTSQSSLGAPKRAQTQPIPVRKPTIALDTSVAPAISCGHGRSPSQTTVPMRSPGGLRLSSRSKSYEKPKVVSQREPIPLKAELFSPLKDKRKSNTSPLSGSMVPSPVEEDESTCTSIAEVDGTMEDDEVKGQASPRDSGLGLLKTVSFPDETAHTYKDSKVVQEQSTPRPEFKVPDLPVQKPRGTDAPGRPSLADRTRNSIAFTSSEDINGFLPEPPSSIHGGAENADKPPVLADKAETVNRRATLIDRTRDSIATMAPPRSKKPSHARSRTSVFPINQFDTPKTCARRSTVGLSNDHVRDITPVEQLFSPDAEYDSVFKTRPKIALSPVLSPYREVSDPLECEIGRSSPLVGVGVGRGG